MPEYEWYDWSMQWWHWFGLTAIIAFLGLCSKSMWGRIVALIGAVFMAWLGAMLTDF